MNAEDRFKWIAAYNWNERQSLRQTLVTSCQFFEQQLELELESISFLHCQELITMLSKNQRDADLLGLTGSGRSGLQVGSIFRISAR